MSEEKYQILEEEDQRKYKRLSSSFPVEFTIVRLQGNLPGINWEKGCTRNVSKTGLCLETSQLSEATMNFLSNENIFLDLRIQVPLSPKAVKAVGEVVWFRKKKDEGQEHYYVGLHFRSIPHSSLKLMLRHAKVKSFFNLFVSKGKAS
ncbi:hypothetical protein MNBD_BACTEROID05-277 [hydrothermal vent metagenome]|uniref:PilZ domain-containing protein n=1 Tax=hydrothermal vent metagenome TaxID=652676 RepID=A0A3B0TED1_9ZZZZ